MISYVKKGESDKNKDGTDDLSRSKFQCAHALADLVNHNYNNAAQKFLSLKFESFDYRYYRLPVIGYWVAPKRCYTNGVNVNGNLVK